MTKIITLTCSSPFLTRLGAACVLSLLSQRRQGVQQPCLQVERSLGGFPAVYGRWGNTKLSGELGDGQSLLSAQARHRFAGGANLWRGTGGNLSGRAYRGSRDWGDWLPTGPCAGSL